jgi:hypothetical protein
VIFFTTQFMFIVFLLSAVQSTDFNSYTNTKAGRECMRL